MSVTLGISFAVRGVVGAVSSLNAMNSALKRSETALRNFGNAQAKALASGGLTQDQQNQAQRMLSLSNSLRKVGTAFNIAASAVKTFLRVLGMIVIAGSAAMVLLTKLAQTALMVGVKFVQASKAISDATEKMFTSVRVLEGRLGGGLSAKAVEAASKAARELPTSMAAILEDVNVVINNPDIRKTFQESLAKGQTDMVSQIAEMMIGLRMTQPDIAARLGLMLPNILGGNTASFRAGFEVRPDQAAKAIANEQNIRGQKMTEEDFKRGGESALRFVMQYIQTLVSSDTLKSLKFMPSLQLEKLTSNFRTLLATLGGVDISNIAKTAERGTVASEFGKVLGVINDNLEQFFGSDSIKSFGVQLVARVHEFLTPVIGWINRLFDQVRAIFDSSMTFGEKFRNALSAILIPIKDIAIEIMKGLMAWLKGVFLEVPIFRALYGFAVLGTRMFLRLFEVINKFFSGAGTERVGKFAAGQMIQRLENQGVTRQVGADLSQRAQSIIDAMASNMVMGTGGSEEDIQALNAGLRNYITGKMDRSKFQDTVTAVMDRNLSAFEKEKKASEGQREVNPSGLVSMYKAYASGRLSIPLGVDSGLDGMLPDRESWERLVNNAFKGGAEQFSNLSASFSRGLSGRFPVSQESSNRWRESEAQQKASDQEKYLQQIADNTTSERQRWVHDRLFGSPLTRDYGVIPVN